MEATTTKRLTEGHRSSARPTGAAGSLSILAIAGALAAITGSECHANLTLHHIAVSFTPSFLYGVATWFWWAVIALFLGWCALYQPIILRFSLRTVLLHLWQLVFSLRRTCTCYNTQSGGQQRIGLPGDRSTMPSIWKRPNALAQTSWSMRSSTASPA